MKEMLFTPDKSVMQIHDTGVWSVIVDSFGKNLKSDLAMFLYQRQHVGVIQILKGTHNTIAQHDFL